MDTNLVTAGQWQSVFTYAANRGYSFSDGFQGYTNQPSGEPMWDVVWIDWVIWCNARSQQAGLTPVYYTDAGFTQLCTNSSSLVFANWSANGYRLPTEAEWEKASRGGLSGQRFPWGNTISESQANYNGDSNDYSYDLGPDGYNSTTLNEGGSQPGPVGSFAPNGYGLYDMAGNLFEWCWDLYAEPPYPAGSPYLGGADPRGPASESIRYRVLRGGSWARNAGSCRCANRYFSDSQNFVIGAEVGARCVRGH
jgi:formylglycine-generating enzyme required for sulfatase activity